MTSAIRKSLLLDAFYQVLDNKIFRFLIAIVLGMVATSFVIAFGEERVEILYGWASMDYDFLLGMLGRAATGSEDPQAIAIQAVQGLVVGFLAGAIGMVFCVSATAFFVPRMLEKGSADIVFSKPLSRLRLLLARYFAGVIFVSLLSLVLVGGIYLGLTIGSSYHDPGFLWSALTLIYLFSILHAVSTWVGVVTRSTVAAILVSIMFFIGTGCVHNIWVYREWSHEKEIASMLREANALPEALLEDEDAEAAEDGTTKKRKANALVRFFGATFDAMHYALPKTSDADYISNKLLVAVSGEDPELLDDEGKLTVLKPPSGFVRATPRGIKADLDHEPAVWRRRGEQGVESGRIELRRRARTPPGEDPAKGRKLSSGRVAREHADRLKREGLAAGEVLEDRGVVDGATAVCLGWMESAAGGSRARQAVLFTFGDWLFEVDATLDPHLVAEGEPLQSVKEFTAGFKLARDEEFLTPDRWYERRLGWTSELKYNIFFSIGSSVAFAALMIALAWWKLSRIDF